MNYTENYDLGLPLVGEQYDVTVFNTNYTIIDSALKNNSDGASSHIRNKQNPHEVTAAQIGLGNVNNTSDAEKPVSNPQAQAISSAVQTEKDRAEGAESALSDRIDAISGAMPGIATTSTAGLVKPDGITITILSDGTIRAPQAPLDSELSTTSHNAVWNSTVAIALNGKQDALTFDDTPVSGSNNPVKSGGLFTALGLKANTADLGSAAYKNVPTSGDALNSQVVLGNDSRLSDARQASDVYAWAKAATKPTYTASEVGAIASSLKGAANGVAELDANGLVPASQLPSYVDDVLEYSSLSNFPATGESGKIYIAADTNRQYRWSGSLYAEISASLALGETSSTAYRGDRGKIAYDHSQLTSGNPHNVTKSDVGLGNVGNYKAVSTVASQGLTDTEKSNARANIGAGTSSLTLGTTSSTAYRGDYGNAAYTHAVTNKGSAFSSGLYKITTNSEGHVTGATAVEKADITALGIPGSNTNTTYSMTRDGSSVKLTPSSGSAQTVGLSDLINGLSTDTSNSNIEDYIVAQYAAGGTTTTTYHRKKLSTIFAALRKADVTTALGYTPPSTDTNTHRPIQLNGTQILGNNTTALNFAMGANVTLTNSGGTITIGATNTTYTSKAAVEGGTDESLVTTGEKYTWNHKSSLAIGTTSTTAAAGNHTHGLSMATDSGTAAISLAANTVYKLTAGGSTYIFKTPADNNTTYGVVSTSANGLAPKVTDTSKFLKGDGTWATPTNTTYSVVSKTANGLCPQLPNETTTTKYLRQDGSWVAPPNSNTTYTFATGSTNGAFTVTPSGGSAQTVSICGLGSAAYTASTAYAAASHTHNYAGSSSAGGAATSLANFKVTTTSNLGVDAPGTNAVGYVSGLTKANWNYQQTDGALYTQWYNAAWEHEIFGDYRTGQISIRGKNNGTWQSWRRVLDETNYSSIISGYAASSHTHTKSQITDFPTIPTVNNATLTIQKNGASVATFTANAASNVTCNITVPTKTSDLTNDSGFITNGVTSVKVGTTSYTPSSGVVSLPAYPTVNNATLTIQKNGTTVNSFTANASSNVTANITVPTKTSELTNDSGFVTSSTSGVSSVATGTSNGTISVTTNGSTANVAVKGLGSAAYTASTAYAAASHTHNYAGSSSAGGDANAAIILERNLAVTNTSGMQYTRGSITIGTADGNAKEGSNGSYKLWSYPAGGTAINNNTTANIQNIRFYWGSTYFRDVFISPNNSAIYHRTVSNGSPGDWYQIYDTGHKPSWSDISNKPTIPTVNNATLTIQKNGTSVGTFTANASSNATANITVPTKVSELTNDSGYTTNTGTVTSIKVGSTSYSPSSGVVSLPAYPSNTTYTFATGDSNGQIKVTPSGGSAQNVSVKGLGTAAYTASTAYATSTTLTNQNLNNVTTPGFYDASGDNTCANKPSGVTAFGLEVFHTAGGTYHVQILHKNASNDTYRRYSSNGSWSSWTQDIYTDTHDAWTSTATVSSSGTVAFSSLNDSYGYDLYCENKIIAVTGVTKSGSGTSTTLTYTVSGAATGDVCKLRILK